MRLFYVNGQTQVSMPLTELDQVIEEAKNAAAVATPASINGSKAGSDGMGRKRVARKSTGNRRMVSRPTMKHKTKADVLKRRRAALVKARAVLAAKRDKTKARRRQPKRDWGPIIAKRNQTIASRRAQSVAESPVPQEPMAATQ